jgi:hypothetical protein
LKGFEGRSILYLNIQKLRFSVALIAVSIFLLHFRSQPSQ